MTEPLTREQTPCTHSTYWVTVYGNCMACENADLRRQLTVCEQERDRAVSARDTFAEGVESMRQERTTLQRLYSHVCDERDAVKQQCAERDRLIKNREHECEVLSAQRNLADAQCAEAQARVTVLKEVSRNLCCTIERGEADSVPQYAVEAINK